MKDLQHSTHSTYPGLAELPVPRAFEGNCSPVPALNGPRSAVTDLAVISQAVRDAQPTASTLDVIVDSAGEVVASSPCPKTNRLSAVVGDTFYSQLDLNAIQRAALEAQRNGGQVAEKDQLYVDQNGEVMLGRDVGDPSRTSSVVGDTFYARGFAEEAHVVQTKMPAGTVNVSDGTYEGYVSMDFAGDVVLSRPGSVTNRLSAVVGDTFYSQLDLNAIQRAALEAQRNGGQVAEKDQLYVDQNGEVMLGRDVGDPSRTSSVVGDTFYARDFAEEAHVVQTKMPAGTVNVSDGTYEGYVYSITNQFDDKYDLFIYHHPVYDVYRVALLAPRLGGEMDVHGGHLYSDGTLCLTRQNGSGYRSMEQTYAKSALWTLGASLYRRGYGFQFNVGQDGDSRA